MILYRVAVRFGHSDPLAPVLSFCSSWPTLLLLARPFSNAGETLVFVWSVAALFLLTPVR